MIDAILGRSTKSFKREGSSSLVWNEELLLEKMYERADHRELRRCQSTNLIGINGGSRSNINIGSASSSRSNNFARSFSTSSSSTNLRSLKLFASKSHGADNKIPKAYKKSRGKMQEQATSSIAASSLPSSSERSSSSALQLEVKEGMESDDEIRRVPELGGEAASRPANGKESGSMAGPDRVQASLDGPRKRGRSPADKENKRLKRLLRNRVSAQQARERKKAYLIELEGRVKDLEKKNSELEERVSTLQNENQMLRQILKNTTAGLQEGRK